LHHSETCRFITIRNLITFYASPELKVVGSNPASPALKIKGLADLRFG